MTVNHTQSDLSFRELSKITGFHVESLRKLARLGTLPGAYKLGGAWRFRREALDEVRGLESGTALLVEPSVCVGSNT